LSTDISTGTSSCFGTRERVAGAAWEGEGGSRPIWAILVVFVGVSLSKGRCSNEKEPEEQQICRDYAKEFKLHLYERGITQKFASLEKFKKRWGFSKISILSLVNTEHRSLEGSISR